MLQNTFTLLLSDYTNDESLKQTLWQEIEHHYNNEKRFYHTLQHLENLLEQLIGVKSEIKNWNCLLFTVYYHDIIYDTQKQDNEERSADLAAKRLHELAVSQATIESCKQQILATKSHTITTDSDTNFFTDADLSVLGRPWDTYKLYSENIRKEYASYPDLIYNTGRKKVLQHFLAMDRIYKTNYFYQKLENQAKANLQRELSTL